MAFAAINSSKNSATIPVVESTKNQQPPPAVDYSIIDHAFAAESSLRKRIYDAIAASPQHGALFQDIAQYTTRLQSQLQLQHNQHSQLENQSATTDQPAIKKRKLENEGSTSSASSSSSAPAPSGVKDLKADGPLQFYIQDVSFAVPQRKKLTLELTAGGGFLRARNQTSKQIEFGIPVQDIQHILCLPVPEKAQRQTNFCVVPKYGDGVTPVPENAAVPDQMVFTIPDGPAKAAFTGAGQRVEGDENGEALLRRWLNDGISHIKVIRPDEREFVSATPEAHRKGEKAYHVKAHRGSKDGILFGFKKPLVFFSFETIESVSYTSVLQRTFNLNITTRTEAEQETQEFEFSMIDQADFAGIDEYIKNHQLQDASLAEARRAKKYNVNSVKGAGNTKAGDENGEDGEAEEESELQKAQRELEDQEDEDEEDYDPGSEGDSEGSGSSDEDEDEDDDDDGDDDEDEDEDEDGDVNLVKEELGSEAEDEE